MKRLFGIALALFLVSITYLIAALQIPHIGEGAPDWHTVKRPQIPVQSISNDSCPPPLPNSPDNSKDSVDGSCQINKEHPPIAVIIAMQVCVNEPVYGYKYDTDKKQWVTACLGTRAVTKYVRKTFIANWYDTIHCYAIIDDYGRLRALPDFH